MGPAMAVRLGLVLLLLVGPGQIHPQNVSVPTIPTNNSSVSVTSSPVTNHFNGTTPKGHGNNLHATAGLFLLSLSLLHLSC